jgi:hypothetical protein
MSFFKFKSLATSFLSISLFAASAFSGDAVPSITISNLPAAQTLSVFYCNGRPAAMDLGGSNPVLRKVFQSPIHKAIDSSGEVTLPAANIPNITPFFFTNYVVLAVSPTPQTIYVNNSDGSIPTYPGTKQPNSGFTNLANVRYIQLTNYPVGSPISFDFSQPLQ